VEPRLRISRGSNLKHIFINPYEIPNKFLLEKYLLHSNFILLNLHKTKLKGYYWKVLLWKLLSNLVTGIDSQENFFSKGCLLDQKYSKIWSMDPILSIEEDEKNKAKSRLPNSFIASKPTILLAFRESSYYLNCVSLERSPQSSKDYSSRNPVFNDYIETIEWLIEEGFQVIKCGISYQDISYKKEGFINLSTSKENYDELVHFYLCNISLFAINGCCGHRWFSWILNKSSLDTHEYGLPASPCVPTLFTPSIYYCNKRKRLLSLTEIKNEIEVTLPLDPSIDIVHPSPNEILESTKELYYEKINKLSSLNYKSISESIKSKFADRYKLITGQEILPYTKVWCEKYSKLFD
tara:strand:+ start:196 stop:1248 length:1053 start_codon:yes stop_codon:yes gene_type:complete